MHPSVVTGKLPPLFPEEAWPMASPTGVLNTAHTPDGVCFSHDTSPLNPDWSA
jgi:hypothetical protein